MHYALRFGGLLLSVMSGFGGLAAAEPADGTAGPVGEDAATAATNEVAGRVWRNETPAQRDARMRWWREARFGLFIHWGVYAIEGGRRNGRSYNSEWMYAHAKIPVAEYREIATRFNPQRFDATAWVQLAKEAGQKYIVITTKHHDGFALWPSAASSWNLQALTPFKRDPLAELAVACRKEGVRLGFYYSQGQDWTNPGGGFVTSAKGPWDPAQKGDFANYFAQTALPQLRELLTRYGDDVPALFWFDTPTGNMRPERVEQVLELLRPRADLIINNRLRYGGPGDFSTPERKIPDTGFADRRDWEMCEMMNEHWGYAATDQRWKSTVVLLRRMVESVAKGGNYLLNVGPTPEGEIPQASVERLREIGAWMRVHGEAIYGAGPSCLAKTGNWRCTTKPGRVFIHLLAWPGASLTLSGLPSGVTAAKLLGVGQPLPVRVEGAQVTITLPATAPAGDLLPVVALDLAPVVGGAK